MNREGKRYILVKTASHRNYHQKNLVTEALRIGEYRYRYWQRNFGQTQETATHPTQSPQEATGMDLDMQHVVTAVASIRRLLGVESRCKKFAKVKQQT